MTQNAINGINGSGMIQQVISSSLTTISSTTLTIPQDDTIPRQTEGKEIITATITPSTSTSILQIRFMSSGSIASASTPLQYALFQDSTTSALAAGCNQNSPGTGENIFLEYFMTSGTTSPTTFKIRIGAVSGINVRVNGSGTGSGTQVMGGVASCKLIVTEYL